MPIKVHGGTRSGTELCRTCRNAFIRKGAAMGQEVIMCEASYPLALHAITFPIVECNNYRDTTLPPLTELQKVAWVVNADRKTGRVGFTGPEKMDKDAREAVNDEVHAGNPFA